MTSPRCRDCRHYYITFVPNMPYGCRELGFQSAQEPARVVFNSSGQHCLYFSPLKKSGKQQSSD
ncbi:hypothetical protein [Azonexus sp.]|uniref:hypothetical protein n=1 Tax=Azonexus sp. TaxID=1872668 RepID=UPI0039E216EF